MTTQNKFSSGLESGNFVLTSDVVVRAWCAIEQQRQVVPNAEPSLYAEIVQPDNQIIVAFGNPVGALEGQEGFVSSKDFAHFEFLCNKGNPVFDMNKAATTQFQLHYNELLLLKNKLVENSKSKTPSLIIITGQYVGGIIATLFTLWLLEGLISVRTKRPLCITFGSPFVGDDHLRKCVLEFTSWKSCFLHIVSDKDHAPKLFMSRNTAGAYKPFGTFLLCSSSGCAAFEDPNFISEQFVTTVSSSAQAQDPNLLFPYESVFEDLKRKALCNVYKSIAGKRDPLEASIITQLLAVGAVSQEQSPETSNLVGKMGKYETKLSYQKTKNSDSDQKLNEMKICMANLEWYKKDSKCQNIGYYDMYKEKSKETDIKVNEYIKKLMIYWEDSVTEVENKPQLEGANFRVRWLYAGTNYRGMVEPLHIADYYKDGKKNYISDGRPKHFILLEEWHSEKQKKDEEKAKKKQETEKKEETVAESGPSKSKRETVGASLNDDTCFWARVEEALILMKNAEVNTEERKKLEEFEDYVLNSLKNYAVSPEIFLAKSSFMKWWNEYEKIVESSSLLLRFMKDSIHEYEAGKFI